MRLLTLIILQQCSKRGLFGFWMIFVLVIICFRLNEHKHNIRNQETNKSAIAKHFWENDPTFNFHSVKIVCKPNSVFELDFLEAYHIHKNHSNVVNYDFTILP